jgi:GNAT superfamily N-acetyltransferase
MSELLDRVKNFVPNTIAELVAEKAHWQVRAQKAEAELLQARQDNATLAERLKTARDDAERLYIANDGMRGLSDVIERRCKKHEALVAQEAKTETPELRGTENFYHDKYGYCYYEVVPGKNPIIYNLYVEPQYRRQGHSKRLLRIVINKFKQSGYTGEIEIEASPREGSISREKLVSFYVGMGLKVIDSKQEAK